MINFMWLIFGIINLIVLYNYVFVKHKYSNPKYGWLIFFTFYALLFGPVWTLGIILYKIGVKNENIR